MQLCHVLSLCNRTISFLQFQSRRFSHCDCGPAKCWNSSNLGARYALCANTTFLLQREGEDAKKKGEKGEDNSD
jgi:hypothetical protein